jgi:hypothetical protein
LTSRPFIPYDGVFNLDFYGTKFAVPKDNLLDLVEHQTEFVAKASYEVQSSVPLGVFDVFARSLETGTKIAVAKENASAISLLAKELWLEDLLSECSALQIASALSERISKLEHQMSSHSLTLILELKESIANQDRQLESLSSGIVSNSATFQTEVDQLK